MGDTGHAWGVLVMLNSGLHTKLQKQGFEPRDATLNVALLRYCSARV